MCSDLRALIGTISTYKQRYPIDSYYSVLAFLKEYSETGILNSSVLLDALDYPDEAKNEFLHYQLYLATYKSEELMAIGHLDEALRIQPRYDMAAKYRAYYYKMPGECAEVIKLLAPIAPTSVDYDLHMLIGDAWRLCGDSDSAKNAYDMAVRIKPSFEGYEKLGEMRVATHETYTSAAEAFLNALNIKEDARLRTRLGWLYFSNGQIREARASFVLGASLDPCDTQPILGLMHLREWATAKEYYLKATDCGVADFMRSAYGIVLNCHEFGVNSANCKELIDEYYLVFSEDLDAIVHMDILAHEFNLPSR